jgi:hypothetical protein
MKIVLNIAGVFLILAGGTFFLQGMNVITTRSYMRGDPHWVIYGGMIAVLGIALLVFANWKRIRGK